MKRVLLVCMTMVLVLEYATGSSVEVAELESDQNGLMTGPENAEMEGMTRGGERSQRRRRQMFLMGDYDAYPLSICTRPAKWCTNQGCDKYYCKCRIWGGLIPDTCDDL